MKAETQTQQRRTALLGKQENREQERAGNGRKPPQGSSKEHSHSSKDVAEEVRQEMGKETLKQKVLEAREGESRAEFRKGEKKVSRNNMLKAFMGRAKA